MLGPEAGLTQSRQVAVRTTAVADTPMKKIILTICLSVCASAFAQTPPSVQRPGALSSAGGRFVFGQISDFRRDQYLLDTQTGRLWKVVLRTPKNPDGTNGTDYEVLDWVPFIDPADGKLSVVPK